jgi:hypothetical protein
LNVLTKPTTDEHTTDRERSSSGSDWFCIQIDPTLAPLPCQHTVTFVSGVMQVQKPGDPCHLVIVWPERDNEALLLMAALCQSRKRNPQIVAYKESFGPWINYDNYKLYGGPDK